MAIRINQTLHSENLQLTRNFSATTREPRGAHTSSVKAGLKRAYDFPIRLPEDSMEERGVRHTVIVESEMIDS